MMTELNTVVQHWVAFSIVLTVQLLLVLALRKPVRARFGAVACYRLWLLPVVWLPLYFLGPLLLATLATPAPVGGAPGSATPYQQALQQFVEIELLPFNVDVGSTTPAASGDTKIQGWSVLAVLWAAGTVALIFWHARRWLTFSRGVRALGLPLTATERKYTGTSAHFGEDLPVLRLNAMNSAAIFGVFKPVLLLPGSFTQRYDESQRHIILAHEAIHLRRGDNGWNLCAMLLIALLWTNPLIYVAWRYFRLDQELSCDALALTRCNKEQQRRYARTLLESLRSLSTHVNQPALSAWDNLGDIKERSLMVHQHMHLAKRPVATALSLVSLTALGASLTVAFADLVSPVVQAAEALRPMQAIQVTQEAQRAVQLAQQQLQEVQQGVLAAQQRVQVAQRDAQVVEQQMQQTQQEAQITRQQVQSTQQLVQVAQQEVQVAQRQTQEVQQDLQTIQRNAQEAQQEAQAARQEVEQAQQEVQAVQQDVLQQRMVLAQREAELVQAQAAQQREAERAPRALTGGRDHIREEDEDARAVSRDMDQLTARALTRAIDHLNNEQYTEAKAVLADMQEQRLSPFERSRYEQLQFNLDMVDENYSSARNHLQAAIDSGGLNAQESSQMRYQLAQLFIQEQKYAEGAAALQAWIASEPMPNGGAYYLLAAAHYYLGDFATAVGYAEKADEIDRTTGVAVEAHLALLADLYAKLERSTDAERITAEKAKLFPETPAPAPEQPDPVPQARVNPDYPRRALALGLEGWVKVRYTVSETGSVIDAIVVDSKPRRVFDNAAIKAISNWRYDPAMEDAVAVQYAGMETTFRFTLADL